MIKDFNH